jgi:ABC-type multidrug transport system fused ATPase/permease subunit
VFPQENSSERPARTQLLKSLRTRAGLALATFLLMGFSAAATAGYAWLVGPLLLSLEGSWRDGMPADAPGPSMLSATEIAWFLVALGAARALAETARASLSSRLQLRIIREFRGIVLAHVLRLEPSVLMRWSPGELASRIQVEVHGVRTLLHLGVAQAVRSLVLATALATVALRVDTALAMPGLVMLPVAVLAIVLAARPARRLQRELFAAESSVVSATGEAVDGAALLRAYGAVDAAWESIDVGASRSEERGIAAETWNAAAAPLVELVAALAIAVVFAVAWSTRSPVNLAATGTVLAALVLMYRPLHGLAQSVFGWWSGLAALDRLDELLSLPTRAVSRMEPRRHPIASMSVGHVCFAFGEQPVLKGVSASFRAGELVAITGASGAGKSTLLALLAGVLPSSDGEICIDGAPASHEMLNAVTAWMPQTPVLFHETILRNIALGTEQPDRERVVQLAQRVDAHAFIASRPGGYEGVLREGGTDLSVGQRQRIALARALYRGAPVLLLDEPTSALEDEQEHKVIALCRDHADRGGLVLVATHREHFLRHADRVLELKDGTVSEWERRAQEARLH